MAGAFLAEIQGLSEALRDVEQVGAKGLVAVKRGVAEAGDAALHIFHENAPYKTGKFRESITLHLEEEMVAEIVSSDAQQVEWFRHGTRDHGPVSAQALRFDPGGGIIYRTRVRGIKPNPWEEHARTEAEVAVRGVMTSIHVRLKG